LANAFVSPGVNSRGELVPSHDKFCLYGCKYGINFKASLIIAFN
jgi:hypothetical protein